MAKNNSLNRNDLVTTGMKPGKCKDRGFKNLGVNLDRFSRLDINEFCRAFLLYGLTYPEIIKEYKLFPVDTPRLSHMCRSTIFSQLWYIDEQQHKYGRKLKDICVELCIEKKLYEAMIKYAMPQPLHHNPLYLAGLEDPDINVIFDDYARNYRPVPEEWMDTYYGKKKKKKKSSKK